MTTKPKILIILPYEYGSVGTSYTENIIRILVERGEYEITLVSPSEQESLNIHDRSIRNVYLGAGYLAKYKNLGRLIAEESFDVIHVIYRLYTVFYPLVSIFRRNRDKTFWLLDIRSPILKYGIIKQISQIINEVTKVTYNCISSHCTYSASDFHFFRTDNIKIVNAGTSVPDIDKRISFDSEVKIYKCVYAGSIDERRQTIEMVSAFLEAAKMLRQSCAITVHLDIFGDGDEKYLNKLKNMIKTANPRFVTLKGKVKQQEIFDALHEYQFGLSWVPTLFYDGAPVLKTLEYMAHGVIPIASSTKWHRQLIVHGENGWLCEPGIDNFVAGICTAVFSDSNSKIVHAALMTSLVYDWRYIFEKDLLPIYENAINLGVR